ncbi:YciI family protein [Nocardia cyriacigeorgica]|uniref:YciI family protein n=1 Tax=Nocardia cyriacigeorgica TaxID=135487 RepID=UPI0013B6FB93|nr:YciI family protein [Nocardia cyriacigeorgica]NEW49593.1 YciI family protein [Nocardia cyriacigeorgica]
MAASYNPAEVEQADAEVQEWIAFDGEVREAGIFVHEAGLHPGHDARTVTVRDGEVAVDKGVTGNVGAGFYVLDVPDVDTAIHWAHRIPTARYGHVEVRQVVEF